MDRQKIAEFVNSKDIRKYLQDISYEFTTPQAAWLVHRCRRLTMEKRHAAWREIIRDMPDCAMEERLNLKRIDSFHTFLKDYMELEERQLREFVDNNTSCIYRFIGYWKDRTAYGDDCLGDDDCFTSIQACVDSCRQLLEAYEGDEDKIDVILMYQAPIEGGLESLGFTLVKNHL